ncbi:MAG TPA: hypothetical protein VJS43_16340, partial [Candidatus Acidoferrales bacterium]|nr:hypothetical protein [Candidatus Acidoferrales bacterium]
MTHSHIPEKLATGTPISSILALLVLTLVWTPFSASAGTPPGRAQGANDLYWVCTWSIGLGAKPYYVSDVSRADSMAVAMVTNAFRNYVAAKYNLGSNKYAGSASCVYQTSETAAQTLRQRDLAMPPSGYNVIDTRWKYGMQPTAGGASSAQPPTAPNTPASSAAITSSAAESGGYGVYWVCKWDVGSGNARTQYVTDVMGPTQLFAGSMGLFNRFQAFVIAKYNLGNGGLGNMGACEQ